MKKSQNVPDYCTPLLSNQALCSSSFPKGYAVYLGWREVMGHLFAILKTMFSVGVGCLAQAKLFYYSWILFN